jgi:DNA-binding beta-propeller fold protein YncE
VDSRIVRGPLFKGLACLLGLALIGAIVLWPLGFRKKVRSWWYSLGGEHHGCFQDPEGLSVDVAGNLYVADEKRLRIHWLDPRGKPLAVFKNADGYDGPLSTGNRMAVIEPGRFFILGCRDDVVEIQLKESKAYALRSFTAPPAPGMPPFAPESIAYDPAARELYASDEDGRRLVVFDAAGAVARTIAVDHLPEAVCLFEDRIYVSMPKAGWVSCYGKDGRFRLKFGERELTQPETPVVSPDRKVYVSDNKGHKIEVYDLDGRHFFTIGGPGRRPGEFNRPQDIAFLPDGNLVVADSDNHRVQVLSPAGAPLRIIE